MLETFAKRLFFGILSLGLFTSPISEKEQETKFNSKYKSLQEFLSSPDYLKCILKSNEIKYITDSVRYGKEYWQSFEETDSLKTGDCNDKSPYLCHLLNQKYPGFYISIGYLDSSKRSKKHMWIEHEEDTNLVMEPNYIPNYIHSCSDNLCSIKILNRKELEKGAYYNTDMRNYEGNFNEFKKRTKTRIPIKEPKRR
jgi:hypothetical protein